MPTFRIMVKPSQQNGLLQISQIMVDKIMTIPKEKVGGVMGHLEQQTMMEVNQALAIFLDIVSGS